jgi:hypothetical protein
MLARAVPACFRRNSRALCLRRSSPGDSVSVVQSCIGLTYLVLFNHHLSHERALSSRFKDIVEAEPVDKRPDAAWPR